MTSIVWFRADLRLADNPALDAAIARKEPIVPLFIYSPKDEGEWSLGGASKWWLHHSLLSIAQELLECGAPLVIRRGDPKEILDQLMTEISASAVFWNRRYEPTIRERDSAIKEHLKSKGIIAESFNGALLLEPWEGVKADKSAYQVFTPFWRNALAKGLGREPLPAPKKILGIERELPSESIDRLKLLPSLPWAAEFLEHWEPGTAGAKKALQSFLRDSVTSYSKGRDRPDQKGTSRLSPHLHFGEVSPHQVLAAIQKQFGAGKLASNVETYVKELGWREFGYHLLYYFPHTPTEPLRADFKNFPWVNNPGQLKAWQQGKTGYPIVDAGMRELWRTGWMHNRVRMIVASFLVKDLRLPWQSGARWFWDTLVDADLASNTLGWQWAAGCGADAAPYFRIFNPTLQGEKFDPEGTYVKRWCPELSNMPAKWIHKLWDAPPEVLEKAGVKLGKSYPLPMVDHSEARDDALEAYETISRKVSAT